MAIDVNAPWNGSHDDPITPAEARAVAANWRDTTQLSNALDAMALVVEGLQANEQGLLDELQRQRRALEESEENANGLLEELERERAMFRAINLDNGMPVNKAKALLALSLASYINRWFPSLRSGMTLTKSHELTLHQIEEMAAEVAAVEKEKP